MSVIYYSKMIQTKISKGKAHGTKSNWNQAQAANSSLPVESHRTCLIPPAANCDNMCEVLSMKDTH